MKGLNLDVYGVQEMNAEEMRKTNGGGLGGLIWDLIQIVWETRKETFSAACEIKREGGTLAADMPFK